MTTTTTIAAGALGMSRQRLRIFVSSPGDVTAAREIAAQIIEKLAHEFARFFAIEPYLWEYEPMLASGHFQDSIDPPSKFDAVILILESRLGTALPERTAVREYRGMDGRKPVTGTEWEYEDALQGAQARGVPDLLVYRSRRKAEIDTWDAQSRQAVLKQIEALDAFWSRHFANRGAFMAGYAEFRTLEEFVRRLEQDLRACIQRRVDALNPTERAQARLWPGNPFRGLEAYEFEHAPIFFGREEAIGAALLRLITNAEAGHPFLLVLGASGSGKSSLVKAGVLPRLLVPQRVTGTAFLRRVVFRPGDAQAHEDLFDALARRLTTGDGESTGLPEILGSSMGVKDLARHLRESSAHPDMPFAMVLDRLAETARAQGRILRYEQAKLIVEVDQLEELFTSERVLPEERQRFMRLLAALVRSGLVWVIATMRADFWHRVSEIPDLLDLSDRDGRLDLRAPSSSELSQMLRGPVEAAAIHFEVHPVTGIPLNDLIAQEAAGEPGALPLLSFLLDQLYQKDIQEAGGDTLDYASYSALGGLKGAIATRADAVIAAQPPDVQQALRPVLFALIQMSAGEGGVERAVARRALLAEFPEGSAKRRLIEALLDPSARLLVADAVERGESTVRLAHEALISQWSTARNYVVGNAEALKTRRMLEERYARWQAISTTGDALRHNPAAGAGAASGLRRSRFGREQGLLTDVDLIDGRRLLQHYREELSPELIVYVERSVAEDERIRRRSFQVLSAVAGLITILAAAASVAAWLALQRQHEAEYQATQTLQAQVRLLTEDAGERLKDGDIGGARGIILEVLTTPQLGFGRTPNTLSVFQEMRAADLQLAVFTGGGDFLNTAVYSPDATRILTSSYDRTARIYDAQTALPIVVIAGHRDIVNYAVFSPDGTRVATASRDRTARVWDARSGAELAVLRGHGDVLESVGYSPDGTRLVTASDDRTARIWDARTGALVSVLAGHGGVVESATFSPDGTEIVTASDDRTARVWNLRTGTHLVLSGHTDRLFDAVYSPDGKRIVTASGDKTARIWDARSGGQLAVLAGHTSRVNFVAYSPDGTRIVTASYDKTARIWDAGSGAQLAVLSGHDASVISAAFSPDGKHVVTTSNDKTVRIWKATNTAQLAVLSGHEDVLGHAVFSPDGTRVVTTSEDATARIWDAATGVQLLVLRDHDRVYDAAYAADGARIATASYDKVARTWDPRSGHPLAMLLGHRARVNSVDFSPDGSRIVTSSYDRTARIWDSRSGAQLSVLSGHGDRVTCARYSPDGSRIVTTSYDRTSRVWDAHTSVQLLVLSGHGSIVRSAAYSPDGMRIVTASYDQTARIWDAHTGTQLAVLSGHESGVVSALFSPDGTRIVTASLDGSARIWDARSGEQLAVLYREPAPLGYASYSPDGRRIVIASGDRTARIWDAATRADVATQVSWAAAAQPDTLSAAERTRLGLPADPRLRSSSNRASPCDQAAASPYDPDRLAPGVFQLDIVADIAMRACVSELARDTSSPRLRYQVGRALLAAGDARRAAENLSRAIALGSRAAQIDLANLKRDPSRPRLFDPESAAALYVRAWQGGVSIAAFDLGKLYEDGVPRVGSSGYVLAPDAARAWSWYQKGADSGEPNALARFGEKEDLAALSASNIVERNSRLLRAFRYYASASERARLEDWPDSAWREWRYRRASLARLLADDGMIEEVAQQYDSVLEQYAPHPTIWQRVASFVGLGK
jgi:WD40 repeat protein